MHANLKLHHYKIMLAQELLEKDHANSRDISADFLDRFLLQLFL